MQSKRQEDVPYACDGVGLAGLSHAVVVLPESTIHHEVQEVGGSGLKHCTLSRMFARSCSPPVSSNCQPKTDQYPKYCPFQHSGM